MLRNALWFLDAVGFCLNFALNLNEFWLFPGYQSYWVLFFIFLKNPKISNLSRDKAPEFQNNVIVDMKTALDGGKKEKTQLFRRRGHRKIKKNVIWLRKICRVKMTPPLDILGLRIFLVLKKTNSSKITGLVDIFRGLILHHFAIHKKCKNNVRDWGKQ